MYTIRCTQKVLKRQKLSPAGSLEPTTNALGAWYVNLAFVGHHRLAFFVSEHGLLSVMVRIRDFPKLPGPLTSTLSVVLRELGVPKAAIEAEIGAMQESQFSKTASRSVLASMTQLSYFIAPSIERYGLDFVSSSLFMARPPMQALDMFRPRDVVPDLFK